MLLWQSLYWGSLPDDMQNIKPFNGATLVHRQWFNSFLSWVPHILLGLCRLERAYGWMGGWVGGWVDIVDNVSLTLSSLADPKTKIWMQVIYLGSDSRKPIREEGSETGKRRKSISGVLSNKLPPDKHLVTYYALNTERLPCHPTLPNWKVMEFRCSKWGCKYSNIVGAVTCFQIKEYLFILPSLNTRGIPEIAQEFG